jgi:hypothetical protein
MNEPFRIEEVKFMPEISEIIKCNFRLFPQDITFVELSTSDEDTKESFDLVYKSKVDVSIRIRKNKFSKYADLTIRSKAKYGGKTELDKLIEGKGSIYLYAWKTINEEMFQSWVLVDINKIRDLLTEYIGLPDIPNYDKNGNKDGTAFKAFKISTIAAYDALINSFNLPKHCLPEEIKPLPLPEPLIMPELKTVTKVNNVPVIKQLNLFLP